MATFILVHGMFHGAWCWAPLKRRLEACGHQVIARDLPGCGDDTTPHAEVSFDLWVASVVADLRQTDGKAVLVGHSRGGFVVSQAAEAASKKVAVAVYLTALMLPDGAGPTDLPQIVIEQSGQPVHSPVGLSFSNDQLSLKPPPNAGEVFLAGCAQEIQALEWKIAPEPFAPLLAKLSLSNAGYGSVSRLYVRTLSDRVLPISSQDAMIALSPPDRIVSVDTGHSPMLSDIELTASLLRSVADHSLA